VLGITKYVAGAAVAGLLYLGVRKVTLLDKVGDELEAIPSVKVHQVTLLGAVLRVDVKLKNPTNGTMRLVKPFLKVSILQGGVPTQIGTSDATSEVIDVPKNGEVDSPPMWVSISFLNLAGPLFSIVKDLFLNWNTGNRKPVALRVYLKTRVNGIVDKAIEKDVNLA